MFERIKEFLKDSSLYGISQVLAQLIGFFLLPIYTKYLTPEDYAIITLLGFYSLFYKPISNLGIPGAAFRFIGFSKRKEEEEIIIATAGKIILFSSLVTALLSIALLDFLQGLLLNATEYKGLLIVTIITAFFSVLYQFPFIVLRIRRKMKLIFYVNSFLLLATITLNIVFVVVLHMGVAGVVYATLIATFISFVVASIVVRIPIRIPISRIYFNRMLNYGLPNVPHHLQTIMMMIFAQYAINRFLTPADLGLYAIAWRFCLPFQLLVTTIHSSWTAYKFHVFKVENSAKKTFSFFTFGMSMSYIGVYFFISVFGGYALQFMTNPAYHEASIYLPYICLIPLFNGLYFIFATGVAFGLKQNLAPAISITGLVVTIGLSFLLIPKFGIQGAALATAFGWLVMTIAVYLYNQSIYPIDYLLPRVVLLFMGSVILAGIVEIFELNSTYRIGISILFLLFFYLAIPTGYRKRIGLLIREKILSGT